MGNSRVCDEKFDRELEQLLEGKKLTDYEIKQKIENIKNKYGDIPILRVCSFGRVSTNSDEQESSLFTQREIFHNYIKDHEKDGWVLVEEVYDRKSATRTSQRPKFQYILNKARQGYFNILLFKDSKRFSRRSADFCELIEDLHRENIFVVFISEGLNTLDGMEKNGIPLQVFGMVAQSLSDGIHYSVTAANRINMEKELGRMTPHTFGYDKPAVRDASVSYKNAVEEKLIEELFIRLSNLEGLASICADWRARGIKSKLGNEITIQALKRMARCKKYIGILEMHKSDRHDVRTSRKKLDESEWIIREREDLRIVSDELFYKVQDILDSRMKDTDKNNKTSIVRKRAFSGVIVCGCCGTNLLRVKGGSRAIPHTYFGCDKRKHPKRFNIIEPCENSKNAREDELMELFREYFKQLLNNKAGILELVKNEVRKQLREKYTLNLQSDVEYDDIVALEKRLERIIELYKDGMVDKSEVTDTRLKLNKMKENYASNKVGILDDAKIKKIVNNLVRSVDQIVESGLFTDNMDGFMFNSLFDSIILNKDGSLVVNFRTGEKNDSALVNVLYAG